MIRTQRAGDTWNLQTAALYLRNPETGRHVTLISMIHIGRADYYAHLGRLVNDHDGLVLFEGVGELTPEEVAVLSEEEREVYKSLSQLNEAYRRLAEPLGLVAQPDAMPKPRPDWVRADLPVKELLTRWVAARLPLIPVMDTVGRSLESAFLRRATRLVLLQQPLLVTAFQFLRGHVNSLGRLTALLIDERNAAALASFDTTDGDRDVLMTYGAGHVPGLLAGFHARGFREYHREWHTAHAERIPYSDLLDRVGRFR